MCLDSFERETLDDNWTRERKNMCECEEERQKRGTRIKGERVPEHDKI